MKPTRPRLQRKFQPSEPCSCNICVSYCARPGWWTVEEARLALQAGYGGRMMLEVSPEHDFGVLSPAFKGCEGGIAFEEFARHKCTFLQDNLCELHGTGFQPLECRVCHHERPGVGPKCHAAILEDWKTLPGRQLVARWCRLQGLWQRLHVLGLDHLKHIA